MTRMPPSTLTLVYEHIVGWVSVVLRSRKLIIVLIGIGIAARLAHYLANRSLWVDEAWLALNLIERPLFHLTGSLDFGQAAPPGFLLVEGTLGRALGFSEYALRLFPLICGIASIPAFAWLAGRIVSPAARPLAVLLFVVADGLVYYSAEVKPYSTDVAVSTALLAAAVLLDAGAFDRTRNAFVVAFLAVVLVVFSFPAAFVLAGASCVVGIRLLTHRRSLRLPAVGAVILWSTAAIAISIFAARRANLVRKTFEVNSGRFLGISGSSSPFHALNVMGTELAAAIGFPQQRPFNHVEKIALFCVIVGGVALLRRAPRQLLIMILPFFFVFGASAMHFYPISERTDLFLVPVVVLLAAEGVAQIIHWTSARSQPAIAFLLVSVVALGPVWLATKRFVHPDHVEEMRPVLEFIRDHWKPGDTLYVHYGAQYALVYYEKCGCVRLSLPGSRRDLWPLRPVKEQHGQYGQAATSLAPDLILGRYHGGDRRRYIQDLERIRFRSRVWFLYSHVSAGWELSLIQDDLLRHLDSLGKRIAAVNQPGAHAYLYQFRQR